MTPFLIALLLLTAGAAGWVILRLLHSNARLRSIHDQVLGEEERAFAFLRGLGGQIQRNQAPSSMHRYLVEGIATVLDCPGAALYLLDTAHKELVPMLVSSGCPLYLEVPDSLLLPGEEPESERLNYLRLHSIPVSHPVYGRLMEKPKTLGIENLEDHAALPRENASPYYRVRLLAGPLIYADQPIGLLITARAADEEPFTENDKAVFESLADQSAFALGSAMIHRTAHEKQVLDADLRTASEFERILLPTQAPEISHFDISGVNHPALIVSGDYYDYVPVDDDHLGIAIADVAGKGLPASLIMATCRSILRAQASLEHSPSKVLGLVNEQIFPDIREDMFITMTYLILNANSDTVLFARAGHNASLILRQGSGEIEAVEPVGMALGIDNGPVFQRILSDCECELRAGDVLLLYTDGVTEAPNGTGEEYGLDRLCQALLQQASRPAGEIVSAIFEDLRTFCGTEAQSDDITLIAIKKG